MEGIEHAAIPLNVLAREGFTFRSHTPGCVVVFGTLVQTWFKLSNSINLPQANSHEHAALST